jgi:hypothetical protein
VSESVSIDGGFAAGACGIAKRLRQEKKPSGAYRRQQYFHHAQSTACAPKVYEEEILSVSAPREGNSSGEGLDVAGFVCDVTTLSAR